MLDLIFLILMIIVLLKSLKGDFNLLMCNIATVIGVIAAIIGIITAFFSSEADSYGLGLLNTLVLTIAFMLKPVAKHFAKVYQDKIDEEVRSYYEEEKNVKENFFRKVASDEAYMHAAERGTNPPNANSQVTRELPQGYNGGMEGNAAFPQTGNAIQRPTVANNVTFLPDGSIMPNPVVTNNVVIPRNGYTAPNSAEANSAAFPQNGNPAASPMAANSAVFPQNVNPAASPMAANSAVFPQNVNPTASPMTANSTAFPQNGNPAASPMTANSAVFPQNGNATVDTYSPKMEGISPISITDTQPTFSSTDDNYGLPYDLSAPIDLDHGIDDISPDSKK